LVKIDNYYL